MEDVNIILNYNTPIQTIDDWNDINLIEPSIHGESCINFEEYSECIFYPSDIDIFVSYKQTEKENLLQELNFKHETDMEDDEEKYEDNGVIWKKLNITSQRLLEIFESNSSFIQRHWYPMR